MRNDDHTKRTRLLLAHALLKKHQGIEAGLARRAVLAGGYRFGDAPCEPAERPGFFRVASGIGCQFVRLSDPDAVASALFWA